MTLVLGGARSGKSAVAERLLAGAANSVTYLATAPAAEEAADPDLVARIAAHRARRPVTWATLEVGDDLVAVLEEVDGPVLLDGLGGWLARRPGFAVDTDALCAALRHRSQGTVVVSEEVGLGVHPSTEAGRRFRDALGVLNQAVAAAADEVLLVVAGRVLRLDTP